jgi:flagellar motor switch protein FliN/FliY
VGRSQIRIEDLLELDQGSIVELQSAIGEPLDIRVNEKLVARGEIVVINDKFAVRITDIISPDDRFAAL